MLRVNRLIARIQTNADHYPFIQHPRCRRKVHSTLTQDSMPCRRCFCLREAENWSWCKWVTICSHLLLMVQKWVTLYIVVRSQQWNQRSHRKNLHFPIADATDSASHVKPPRAKRQRLNLNANLCIYLRLFLDLNTDSGVNVLAICRRRISYSTSRFCAASLLPQWKSCQSATKDLFSSTVMTNNNNNIFIIDEKSVLYLSCIRDFPVLRTHKQLSMSISFVTRMSPGKKSSKQNKTVMNCYCYLLAKRNAPKTTQCQKCFSSVIADQDQHHWRQNTATIWTKSQTFSNMRNMCWYNSSSLCISVVSVDGTEKPNNRRRKRNNTFGLRSLHSRLLPQKKTTTPKAYVRTVCYNKNN